MNIELSAEEARVIGCLIEKQITTPDQYPLSLNALTNACNQKTNREPVMALDEPSVQHTVDALARRHFIMEKSGFGSRVPKFHQRFCNSEYGTLKFSAQELAIVCELLLRGAQTAGELRTRAARMASFADITEVESALKTLMERADGPFVARLARESGQRDVRYTQLFSKEGARTAAASESARAEPAPAPEPSRLERLEADLRALRAEVEALKSRIGG
jgi:uncharacterized protein YceH (UPF0502 family)